MKKVIVPIAKGFEEIELVSIADILRRCQIAVEILSLESSLSVVGAHGITLQTDGFFGIQTYEDYDCIALAGGYENMQNMRTHQKLEEVLNNFRHAHKLIAAICASPIVLAYFGILEGDFTCYPSCQQEAISSSKKTLHFMNQKVCFIDRILTSQGPATAMEFALRLADILHTQDLRTYQTNTSFQNPLVQHIADGLLYQ
ncbi:DJ-1 family glyoxalase III [uncultured Helicobacter sp.]|uniref:DJ-1 family glyoxalase III n=1 Tax=uncultured Helicobacter sp. TaxID=175537 RepID=UPI00374E8075